MMPSDFPKVKMIPGRNVSTDSGFMMHMTWALLVLAMFSCASVLPSEATPVRLWQQQPPAYITPIDSADDAPTFMELRKRRLEDSVKVTHVPIDDIYGVESGNPCDIGNLHSHCVIERPKVWSGVTDLTVSSAGAGADAVASVPLQQSGSCTCDTPGCTCRIKLSSFIPRKDYTALSSATLTVEVAGTDFDTADKAVEWIQVEGNTIASNITVFQKDKCDGFFPVLEGHNVLEAARDDEMVVEVKVTEAVACCCRPRLAVRAHIKATYLSEGVLELRPGGALQCSTPGCTLRIRNLAELRMLDSSHILAENVDIQVPQVRVGGEIVAIKTSITAAQARIEAAGKVLSADRVNTTASVVLNVHPRNLLGRRSRELLLANPPYHLTQPGCENNCVECRGCLMVAGSIRSSTVLVDARGASITPGGDISASERGFPESQGPAHGIPIADTGNVTGGGGGHGGSGSFGCGVYRWGFDASVYDEVQWEGLGQFGSGGSAGQVQGGQGGGSVFIKTLRDCEVSGSVTADGEDSRCSRDGNSTYSAGGGGAGGSISLLVGRLLGGGSVSARGGNSMVDCSAVEQPFSGGAGGGGRISISYQSAASSETVFAVQGGGSLCTPGGAGTVMDISRQTLVISAQASSESFIVGQLPIFPIAALTPVTPTVIGSATIKTLQVQGTGAVVSIPGKQIDSVRVIGGAALLSYFDGFILNATRVVVEDKSFLGCVPCGIGAAVGVFSLPSCAISCKSVSVSADSLSISQSDVLGTNMSLHLNSLTVDSDSRVATSDTFTLSSGYIQSRSIDLSGTIAFSTIRMIVARAEIRRSGHVSTDSLGMWGGTGQGNGTNSNGGGGGGGHGGSGASGCSGTKGGFGYSDAYVPLQLGSGGGHGGGDSSAYIGVTTGAQVGTGRTISTYDTGVSYWEVSRFNSIQVASGRNCEKRGLGAPCTTCCPSGFVPSAHADYCCSSATPDCDCVPGGSEPPSLGGRGGGMVFLTSSELINNDGRISSQGTSVVASTVGISAGGGGSGGSIYIQSVTFSGEGEINAFGGHSAAIRVGSFSGGAGAGGRISLEPARGVPPNMAIGVGGGSSGGCASGGYGSVYIQRNLTLLVGVKAGYTQSAERLCEALLTAIRLDQCPFSDGKSFANLPTNAFTELPLPPKGYYDSLVVTAGAMLAFPKARVKRLEVRDSAMVVALGNDRQLVADSLSAERGAVIGCAPCALGGILQNNAQGCGDKCTDVSLHVDKLAARQGSKVVAINLTVVSDSFVVDETSYCQTSDPVSMSSVVFNVTQLTIEGVVQFSSVHVMSFFMSLDRSGLITTSGLGHHSSTGPGAGLSSGKGGGGAGHGGFGASSCSNFGAGVPYGSAFWPDEMGSGGGGGGGSAQLLGGRGGGRVLISCSSGSMIEGSIKVDGNPGRCHPTGAAASGGGSGGSILINSPAVDGAGTLSAVGGSSAAGCPGALSGGGGAGGRVAVYTSPTIRGLSIRTAAFGGFSTACTQAAAGTLFYNHSQTISVDQGHSPAAANLQSLYTPLQPTASVLSLGETTVPSKFDVHVRAAGFGIILPFNTSVGPEATRPLSAITPCPIEGGSLQLFISGGAVVSSCAASPQAVTVSGTGALWIAQSNKTFSAHQISISRGGLIGCLPCPQAEAAGNGHASCGMECPNFSVQTAKLTVNDNSGVMGSVFSINATTLNIEQGGFVTTTDNLAPEHEVTILSKTVVLEGIVTLPSIVIRCEALEVRTTGTVDASGLGFPSGQGPNSGLPSPSGGGGGGGASGLGGSTCALTGDGIPVAAGGSGSVFSSSSELVKGSGGGSAKPNASALSVEAWTFFVEPTDLGVSNILRRSGGVLGDSTTIVTSGEGGRGGGIILLEGVSRLVVDGKLAADGVATGCAGEFLPPGGGGGGGSIRILSPAVGGFGSVSASGGKSFAGCGGTSAGGGGGGGAVAMTGSLISLGLQVSVDGGATDCRRCEIGRSCINSREGCVFSELNDEFDGVRLGQRLWQWQNEPRNWSVGTDQEGWLTISPSPNRQAFNNLTAHMLYMTIDAEDIIDFGTSLSIEPNNSDNSTAGASCMDAGVFIRSYAADDWVTLSVVDSGTDSTIRLSKRSNPLATVMHARQHGGSSRIQLRLRKAGNGRISGLWRLKEEDVWSVIPEPALPYWPTGGKLQVGIYTAWCGSHAGGLSEPPVSQYDPYWPIFRFDWVRDWTCDAAGRSLAWSGFSGAVVEQAPAAQATAANGSSLKTSVDAGRSAFPDLAVLQVRIPGAASHSSGDGSLSAPAVLLLTGSRVDWLGAVASAAPQPPDPFLWQQEMRGYLANTTESNNTLVIPGRDADTPRNLPIGSEFVSRLVPTSSTTPADSVSANLLIDCGGGSLFDTNTSLLIVDMVAEISNCRFSALPDVFEGWDTSDVGFRIPSVLVWRAVVRLTNCYFGTNPGTVGGGGGLHSQHSFIKCTNCVFDNIVADAGGAIKVGGVATRLGGVARTGVSPPGAHALQGFMTASNTTIRMCRSRSTGGAVDVDLGHVFVGLDSEISKCSARSRGGSAAVNGGGSVLMVDSTMSGCSARLGGCLGLQSGSVFTIRTSITNCLAAAGGGAAAVLPSAETHPLFGDGEKANIDGATEGAVIQATVPNHVSFVAYGCTLSNHSVVGVTSDPGDGAVVLMKGGGKVIFDRCSVLSSSLPSAHSAGGFVSVVEAGTLYMRDSTVQAMEATYGAAVRVYTTAHSGTSGSVVFGRVQMLFDNTTFTGNSAGRFGAVLSAHSPSRARFRTFAYTRKGMQYTDSGEAYGNPLVRFGFDGNPSEQPEVATTPPWELPDDGHSTNQWPFLNRDVRTLEGQRAASGGVTFQTDQKDVIIIFKDSQFIGNTPADRVACFFHSALDINQCLQSHQLN